MFFLLYRQKDIDKIIEGNDRNYVIDKLTCEIMEKHRWLQVFGISPRAMKGKVLEHFRNIKLFLS